MSDEINKLDISDEMIAERRGNQNKMPDDMPKLMANIILKIDTVSSKLKNIGASMINNPLKKKSN